MRFLILGPVEAHGPDGPVDLGPPKQRAVLAMLLLAANRVVAVDRIVEDLWDGDPPGRAMGAVQAYISFLRRVLEPDRAPRAPSTILLSQAPGYRLEVAADDLDAARFEAMVRTARGWLAAEPVAAAALLGEALGLWRGPVASDFAAEPWVAPGAARLDELRATAVEDRFDALLRSGQSAGLVADLEVAVTELPLRERLWGQLIVALYRAGRQADALQAYQRIRRQLADDIGVDPGPELQAIEASVLAHSDRLDPPPAVAVTAASPAVTVDRIVGRERELATIQTLVGRLATGSGGAVVVTGPAGVGKTRLVDEALAHVPPTVGVAWGRCVDGDAAPPLWPWLQIAAGLGPAGTDLAAALRRRDGAPAADAAGRTQVYEAAVEAVGRVGPLVLVIDDAQWADVASHHIVQLLLPRLADLPVAIVLTVRDHGHATPEVATTLATVARDRRARRLDLEGFDREAVAERVTAHFGAAPSPAAVELLWRRTDGNPFFLAELLRLLPDAAVLDDPDEVLRIIPPSVRDVVGHRLAQLPVEAEQVLTAAAVIGREFDRRIVAAMVGLDVDTLEALDVATAGGLVEPGRSGTRVRFTHDLVREAIYSVTAAARRAHLHAVALTALDEHYRSDRTHANELAAHAWLARGAVDPTLAVRRLLAAAAAGSAALAYEQAEQQLHRALEVTEDVADPSARDLLALDASARLSRLMRFVHGSESSETVSSFQRVRELHELTTDTSVERARVLSELADDDIFAGNLVAGVARSEELIALARELDDPVAESSGRFKLATASYYLGHLEDAARELRRSQALLDGVPDDGRLSMLGLHPLPIGAAFLANVLHMQGDLAGAAEAAAEAADLGRRLGNNANLALNALFAGMEAVMDLDASEALACSEVYRETAAAAGIGLMSHQADLVTGWAVGHNGRPEHGLAQIRRSRGAIAELGAHPLAVSAGFLEGDLLLDEDDPAGALAVTDDAMAAAALSGEGVFLPELHRIRGIAQQRLGHGEVASASFAVAADLARLQGAELFAVRADAAREAASSS